MYFSIKTLAFAVSLFFLLLVACESSDVVEPAPSNTIFLHEGKIHYENSRRSNFLHYVDLQRFTSLDVFPLEVLETHVIRDRVYPLNIKINDHSSVINLDYFIEEDVKFNIEVKNALNPISKKCENRLSILEDDLANRDDTIGRYVLIFDTIEECRKAEIQISRTAFYTSGNIPFSISEDVFSIIDMINNDFKLSFFPNSESITGSNELIFLLSAFYTNSPETNWQADLGWHNTVFFRIFRASINREDPLPSEFSLTVIHESIHRWIGKSLIPVFETEEEKRPVNWVVEGLTDYLALKYGLKNGLIDSSFAIESVEDNINQCLRALGPTKTRAMSSMRRGNAPYKCGFTYFFTLEGLLEQRKQTLIPEIATNFNLKDGAQNFINVSRITNPFSENSENLLMDPMFVLTSEKVFNSIRDILPKAKAKALTERSDFLQNIVMYISTDQCGDEAQGMWVKEGFVVLDTQNCKSLPHKAHLFEVDGFSLTSNFVQLDNHIRKKCNARNESSLLLQLNTDTKKQDIHLPCPKARYQPLYDIDISNSKNFVTKILEN